MKSSTKRRPFLKSVFQSLTWLAGASAISLTLGSTAQAESANTGTAPKSITIGFTPGETQTELKENGEALAKIIEKKIGVPVKIYVSKDYSGLIDAMKAKQVDFAFFSAMSFVFAEKMSGAKVLLKKVWSGPYYYATILSNKATTLKQLKGKSFAFVDEKSTSGYLYPEAFFKKQNLDPKSHFSKIEFTGNHPNSVKLLEDGKVDGIAVFSNDEKGKDTAWERFAQNKKRKPHQLWMSGPIPNDPFCVRQDFYDANPRVATDVMFALRDLDEDPKDGPEFKKLLNIHGLMLATSQQYDTVRDLVKQLDIKLDGAK